jgi:hypothetical protein
MCAGTPVHHEQGVRSPCQTSQEGESGRGARPCRLEVRGVGHEAEVHAAAAERGPVVRCAQVVLHIAGSHVQGLADIARHVIGCRWENEGKPWV